MAHSNKNTQRRILISRAQHNYSSDLYVVWLHVTFISTHLLVSVTPRSTSCIILLIRHNISHSHRKTMTTMDGGEEDRSTGKVVSCGAWCQAEYKVAPFGIVDLANGKTIDIVASFQLQATSLTLILKGLLWTWMVASFVYGWVVNKSHPAFFLAYLSHWTVLYSILYLTLSLWVSYSYLSSRPLSPITTSSQPPHWLIKATWITYTNAVVHGLGVALVFWVAEYSPTRYDVTEYFNIFPHGVSFGILALEGNCLNKIPVRWNHYILAALMGLLFVLWSVLQSLLPVTNPYQEDPEETGDYLYPVLNWDEDLVGAIVVSVVVLIVLFPLLTLFFWGISLRHDRQYLPAENTAVGGVLLDPPAVDTELGAATTLKEEDETSGTAEADPPSAHVY